MGLRWKFAQFLEIRWWRRYLRRKDPASYLQWKKNYWLNFLQTAGIEAPAGSKVLDAGCGPAGIFIALNQCKVDAVDPLLSSYERQLSHFRRDDYPQVSFKEAMLEDFTGAAASYDLVFCLNAINHVSDLNACLHRLTAMTKPDGLLVIAVDVHRYAGLKWLFRALPGDALHPQQHDAGEYRHLLETRHFQVLRSVVLKRELIFDYYLLVAQQK